MCWYAVRGGMVRVLAAQLVRQRRIWGIDIIGRYRAAVYPDDSGELHWSIPLPAT